MTVKDYFSKHKPVMPVTVARTGEGGLPTKELIDWEQLTLDFYDKTISDLDSRVDHAEATSANAMAAVTTEITVRASADEAFASRVTTVEVRLGTAEASIVSEQTARVTADTALATNITTVDARVNTTQASVVTEQTARIAGDSALAADIDTVEVKANQGTASGQVYLIAEAAPSGFSAQYGWRLTVNDNSIGMRALMDGSGLGSIGFVASKFYLIDPSYLSGTPRTVFEYDGTLGTFNFNVPVTIFHEEIGANAVSNVGNQSAYIGAGGALVFYMTVRADASVVIIASVGDTSGSLYLGGFSATFPARTYNIKVDGSTIGTMESGDMVVASNYLGGSSYAFYKAVAPVTKSFNVTGLSAGSHEFALENPGSGLLGVSLVVIEHAR